MERRWQAVRPGVKKSSHNHDIEGFVTSPIAQTGHDRTGEVRLSVYRDPIASWVMAAGLFVLACWGTWDIVHKIQANETTLYNSLMTLIFFWLFSVISFRAGISEAVTSLGVDGNDFVVREYRLFARRETRFAITPVSRPQIRYMRDDEGDITYLFEVTEPGGRKITIARRRNDAAAQDLMADINRFIDWDMKR